MRASRLFVDTYEHSMTPDLGTYAKMGHCLIALKATQGDYHADKAHHSRAIAAHDVGLTVMHYHFCDWTSKGGYRREAELFWEAVRPVWRPGDKLALDFERAVPSMSAPPRDYILSIHAYLHRISSRDARIYGSTSFLEENAPRSWLRFRARWQAQYGPNPRLGVWLRPWWAWQFSDGVVGPLPHKLAGAPEGDVSMLRLDVALRIQAATAWRRRRALRKLGKRC